MSKKNDGGSAFPCEIKETYQDVSRISKKPGMTLRDYFAAKALPEVMREYHAFDKQEGDSLPSDWMLGAAADAYAMADAMLEAREK